MNNNTNLITELERCLADDGIRGALAWLNQRVAHRFTALHVKDLDTLKNIYVFDRDDPSAKPFVSTPPYSTYCALVLATEQPVVITNANQNRDALDSTVPTAIKAYCGLPLRRPDGSIFGTLCHFDYVPREINAEELAVLNAASQVLSSTLNEIAIL